MFRWIMNKIDDWRFEREFQKRKKELMELDPFIYEIPDHEKDTKNKHTEFPPEKY
jgi:hypothetical protein